jgi:nucleoside-diphosphate-sugar epimerase
MPIWLVTGGTGFLGRHVLEALPRHRPAVEVIVLGRKEPVGQASVPGTFLAADLANPAEVRRAIGAVAPSVVLHLAGRTPPGDPEDFYRGNTLATLHLLDALRILGRPARVVLAGSAAELGPVALEDLPVGEDYACRPAESYGLSKWLATAAGLAARPPLEVVAARIFNPIGPGMPDGQAFGRFAARLVAPDPDPLKLTVGDLDARRDFIDVRDVARALIVLAEQGEPGRVFHVGTGQSQRVGDGLDHLIALSRRTVIIEAGGGHTPNPGPRDVRADIGRIVAETTWRPEIPWGQSLEDLLDEARRRLRPVFGSGTAEQDSGFIG